MSPEKKELYRRGENKEIDLLVDEIEQNNVLKQEIWAKLTDVSAQTAKVWMKLRKSLIIYTGDDIGRAQLVHDVIEGTIKIK